MKNITIIHFVHTLFGGVASVAANLIRYQKNLGWKTIVVYANYDDNFPLLVGKDTELIKYEPKNIPGFYMCFGMDVNKIYIEYKKAHPSEKIVCHIHNIQALGAFGNWAKIPIICTLHSLGGKEKSLRRKISNELYRIALIRLLKNKKEVTSVSKAIVKEYAKVPNADCISIIYNGTQVDVSKRNKQESFVIGHVGNLSTAKGWDTVLEAFCLIPDNIRKNIVLMAAGNEGDFTFDYIQKIAEEHGIKDQVHCLGYVGNAKDIFIPKLDILVLASRNEGFGLVQAEAMGYGIPVLGRDVGGICEILKDGYNGFVISTSKDLAKKIQLLYENDNKYFELSRNAIATYKTEFTQDIMCKRYTEKYNDLLEKYES